MVQRLLLVVMLLLTAGSAQAGEVGERLRLKFNIAFDASDTIAPELVVTEGTPAAISISPDRGGTFELQALATRAEPAAGRSGPRISVTMTVRDTRNPKKAVEFTPTVVVPLLETGGTVAADNANSITLADEAGNTVFDLSVSVSRASAGENPGPTCAGAARGLVAGSQASAILAPRPADRCCVRCSASYTVCCSGSSGGCCFASGCGCCLP